MTGWLLCGLLACGTMVLFYSHMEGNLLSATRSHYEDIRRNMRRTPNYRAWWLAFKLAILTRRY